MKIDLPKELATKKLIGLGEVAHGSGGLHQLTGELIKQLISNFGVRTILFEAPMGAVNKINQSVIAGKHIESSTLNDLYFVWRSQENLATFNLIADINRTLSEPVQIVGIDIRQPFFEFDRVMSYTKEYIPKFYSELGIFPVSESSSKAFQDFEKKLFMSQATITHHSLLSNLELFRQIEESISNNQSITPNQQSEYILFCHKICFWLKTYFELSIALTKDDKSIDSAFLHRDQGMFEATKFYLSKYQKNHPITIWAHLGHLMYAPHLVKTDFSLFWNPPLLGNLLKNDLNEDYSTIAIMAKIIQLMLPDLSVHEFCAQESSLEYQNFDNDNPITINFNEQDYQNISIGLTNNTTSPAKESYPSFSCEPKSQFSLAVIENTAKPITPP